MKKSFRNFLSITLFFALIVSCGDTKETSNTTNVKDNKKTINLDSIREQDSIDAEIERIKNNLITNNNVVEKLTAFGDSNTETKILMKTSLGDMKIKLYQGTPLHRANFIMLAKKKYFDSTLFYRVIDNFMIQGGNSDDEDITIKMAAIGGYKIPNEINKKYAHTKGAIAMAVTPAEQQKDKRSSALNFYIVEGRKLSNRYLNDIEARGIEITPANKQKYLNSGGAPHLDGSYTVFGEVYQGFNTLNRISKVKTEQGDWPIKPVYITTVEVIK